MTWFSIVAVVVTVDVVVVRLVVEHVEAQVLVAVVGPAHVDRHACVGEPAFGRPGFELGELLLVAGVGRAQRLRIERRGTPRRT